MQTSLHHTETLSNRPRAIVIGSGLGGLSSGVILAKNGYRVTVLEQQPVAGGCLQCFKRGGAKFETGMHYVGSYLPGQPLHTLLSYLEIANDVHFAPLDAQGYNVIDLNGQRYAIPLGKQPFIESLANDFPHQRKALENYCRLVEKVAEASPFHSMNFQKGIDSLVTDYQLRSMDEVLENIFSDEKLRHVVAGNLPLYAARAGQTPFSTHAFITDFYQKSAARIQGGSDALAKALIQTLARYGGEVITNARVSEIVCNETRATGVVTADERHFDADVVVAAIHPNRLLEIAPSPLLRPAYRQRIAAIDNTIGAFSVYLRFKPQAMPYMNYNYFGYTAETPWICENYNQANWPLGYLYMHHAPDAQHNDGYAHSGVVISYMRFEEVARWRGTKVERRGSDYETFKQNKAQRLLDVVEKAFPNLRNHIDKYWTSTPLTYLSYTGTEAGSMYGIAKDVARGPVNRVHHRTKVPNLWLVGQNINSHGALGVLVGSVVACCDMLPQAGITETLERINKQWT